MQNCPNSGEPVTGNPEPSPQRTNVQGEGVETRRAAPKARTRYGEGIVQTTNAPTRSTAPGEAAKAVAGKKIPRRESAVPVRVRPPAPDCLRGWLARVHSAFDSRRSIAAKRHSGPTNRTHAPQQTASLLDN